MRNILRTSLLLLACSGCLSKDNNAKPEYGSTGLPKNCRAYVQSAINDYRAKKYTADEVMTGLERNCGEHGITWDSN
ncbi:MAG: kynureninase [Burkholderiaceae bacterium]|nr:MAG: kynureninase [Burkholderiaceae bacterium]